VATLTEPAIVGVYESEVGDAHGLSAIEMQALAVRGALHDAGMAMSDCDALYAQAPYSRPHSMFGLSLAEYLGLQCRVASTPDTGGTVTPMTMLLNAIWGIQSGLHGTAVCVFGEAARTGRPHAGKGWTLGSESLAEEFQQPFGLVGFIGPYAMLAQRYLYEYKKDREGFCAVAMSARRHAALKPNATMHGRPMTRDDYFEARMICDPLGLLDCSVISDGAGALVVTAADRAKDTPNRPVSVLGTGMKTTHRAFSVPNFDELGMASAAADAYGAAGITSADMDLLFVHDAFTIATLLTIEGVGLCGLGEGGDYAVAGNLDFGGPCPVNINGGFLSQGHTSGIHHFTEAVSQLRHDCGPRQVDGAEIAVVAGAGGLLGECGVMILGGN
jgi:acetyl-CoA acetyltransferase